MGPLAVSAANAVEAMLVTSTKADRASEVKRIFDYSSAVMLVPGLILFVVDSRRSKVRNRAAKPGPEDVSESKHSKS